MAKFDTKKIDDFLSGLSADELHYAYGKCDDMMEKASGEEDMGGEDMSPEEVPGESETPEEEMSDVGPEQGSEDMPMGKGKKKKGDMIDFSSL